MKLSQAGAFTASLLGSSLVFAHPTGGPLELPATTACFESAVTAGRASGALSGIAAAVVLDGRIVYRRGFGTVSPSSSQAVLPTTRFRIASLNKVMTVHGAAVAGGGAPSSAARSGDLLPPGIVPVRRTGMDRIA